jgi:hypothetical protein
MSAGQAVSIIKALCIYTAVWPEPPFNPALTASALSGFVYYSHFERLDILFGSSLVSGEVLNVRLAAYSPYF